MPRCKGCGNECDVTELVRHENEGTVIVHCPECGQLLGTYNERRR